MTAAKATFALNAGECVRRLFFVIFAPDSQQESSPLSGRKSTQATVRICGASSVCQDWANTKAAYRFFSNERVSEADILSGHFKSTRERIAAAKGPVLVLHDTTEFTYQRERPDLIGMIKRIPKNNSRRLDGKPQTYTTCGILMHSSLAVTLEGLPLGLSAVKFWTRKKFRGVAALRREVNLTRIPIETKESIRWLENLKQSTELFDKPSQCIHIGDR
ncbi:transposase DNA-binding-containing protein, partial [Bradyrhizobium japonicum]